MRPMVASCSKIAITSTTWATASYARICERWGCADVRRSDRRSRVLMKIPQLPLATLLLLALAACKTTGADAQPPVVAETPAADDAEAVEAEDESAEEPEVAEAEPAPEPEKVVEGNLLEVLRKTPDASRFLAELEKAGLDRRLISTDEDTTAIIPTNAAWDSMSKAMQKKMKKPSEAAKILRYHLIPEKMDLQRVMDHGELPTLGDAFMPIELSEGTTLHFGDSKANLVEANIPASNGMAHTIDQVLMPKK
ncbi:MAG TPA: fasciclin domain-containing protein [Nannocystis exedens]|nr:fasciclin domain-containing protein [Nannocystis exedens]